MDFTWIYILVGIILGFLFLLFLGYQWLAYALLGNKSQTIDEEQRNKCETALKEGRAPSMMCRIYVKKGKCPKGKCDVI